MEECSMSCFENDLSRKRGLINCWVRVIREEKFRSKNVERISKEGCAKNKLRGTKIRSTDLTCTLKFVLLVFAIHMYEVTC